MGNGWEHRSGIRRGGLVRLYDLSGVRGGIEPRGRRIGMSSGRVRVVFNFEVGESWGFRCGSGADGVGLRVCLSIGLIMERNAG